MAISNQGPQTIRSGIGKRWVTREDLCAQNAVPGQCTRSFTTTRDSSCRIGLFRKRPGAACLPPLAPARYCSLVVPPGHFLPDSANCGEDFCALELTARPR